MGRFAFIGLPLKWGKLMLDAIVEKLKVLGRVIGVRGFFYLLTMVGLYYYYHQQSLDVLLPIIVGIFVSDLIKSLYENVLVVREDKLKTAHSYEYLKKMYNGNYTKELDFNGSEIKFLYNECFINNNEQNIVIEDQPDKMFDLDPLLKASYTDIMKAHKGSYIKNLETIRLDSYTEESNTLTLKTSRSTYYNHLLTNRAIDYEFDRELSVRKVFEYGPLLNSFENTKMSNHIGINGIVRLSDGYTIIPKRGSKATYSKNKITASIAFPLKSFRDQNGSKKLTFDGLKNDVRGLLKERLSIDESSLSDSDVEVIFLGFGREVYEGGKPQFYFLIKLNTISSADYIRLLKDTKKKTKENQDIDTDSGFFVCDLLSMKVKENYSGTIECINHYTNKVKFNSAEFSFFANYWHVKEAGYLDLFQVNQAAHQPLQISEDQSRAS